MAELESLFDARERWVLAFVPEEKRFDRLRREAAALLKRFPRPGDRPPLFGVPTMMNDCLPGPARGNQHRPPKPD
ncbi:MAG: hypothetical protein ACREH8_05275 [Opitutaceae bacterium]